MNDDLPPLVPPFTALAPIYDRTGFADYANRAAARYLAYALENDWAGRRIIDIGCRTGAASWWLAQQGYRVTGVDESAALLDSAQQKYATGEWVDGSPPEFVRYTLGALDALSGLVDLALAIDGALHAASSLRELEAVFGAIRRLLDDERLLIFDLETIGGMAASAQSGPLMLYDDPRDLTVIARPRFNFETLSRATHYTIWRRDAAGWERADEQHTARGYPVQAVRAVLERSGFALRALLSPDMQPLDLAHEQPARVVFVAQKTPDPA